MTAHAVTDVSDDTFVAEVIDDSRQQPVVVDFWAPWCGPCRVIGPVLESLAEEYAGRVRLVKVNVDENPQLSSQLGIQSIPAVMAFRDGAIADQFVGAVPEPQARAFFDGLLPSEADVAVAGGDRAYAAGDVVEAQRCYERALALDPSHERAVLGLGRLLLAAGEVERAGAVVSPVATWARDPELKRLIGELGFRQQAAGSLDDRGDLEARVAADPDDARAHYALGNVLAAANEWEPALEHLLAVVVLDRALDEDGARRRLVDAFEVLGADHPLTREYRARLSNVLF